MKRAVWFIALLTLISATNEGVSQVRILIRPWQLRPVVLAPVAPLPPPPARPPAPNVGYIDLNVAPADAEVSVDGISVGKARRYYGSSEYLRVEPGIRLIEIRHPGFRTEQCSVRVAQGEVMALDVRLKRVIVSEQPKVMPYQLDLDRTGKLAVKIEPTDATIFINDSFYGMAGQLSIAEGPIILREGTHKVDVNRPGFLPYSTTVNISQNKTIELVVKLQKAN